MCGRSVVYGLSALLYAIVAAVLLGSPKGDRPPSAPEVRQKQKLGHVKAVVVSPSRLWADAPFTPRVLIEPAATPLQGYDRTIVPMVLTGIFIAAGAALSAGGFLLFHVRAAVYARPISYAVDVLGRR